jgi:predicted DNA-binding transcriptional regulator AlpA
MVPKRVLRPSQTVDKVQVCDRQLRDWEAEGKFPKRFKLHPDGRAVAHLESEVDEWIAARAASRMVDA